MTSSTDQLLAKALSTSSEDEAIACLRMARKRATEKDVSNAKTDANTSEAERWKRHAITARDAAIQWKEQAYHEARLKFREREKVEELKSTVKTLRVLLWIIAVPFIVAIFL